MTNTIQPIHPAWLRATHWLNALAVVLLGANGLVYLLCNAGTGRLWTQFFPLSPRAFVTDLRAALRGQLSHADGAAPADATHAQL